MKSVDGAGRFATSIGAAATYFGDSSEGGERTTVKREYVYDNGGEIAYEVQLNARVRRKNITTHEATSSQPSLSTTTATG